MPTIFSTCKPFSTEERHIAQINAIKSWAALVPTPTIILFGNDKGTKEAADLIGAQHIADPPLHRCGSILVNKMWLAAQTLATDDLMVYFNSDIIVGQHFMTAITLAAERFTGPFLMIGHRDNLQLDRYLNFSEGWFSRLQGEVAERGHQHPACGKDYFVFRKPQFLDMPPFIVTAIEWDNWLVWNALQRRVPVIDATDFIKVIHQDHWRKKRGSVQTRINRALFTGAAKTTYVYDATWTLDGEGEFHKKC